MHSILISIVLVFSLSVSPSQSQRNIDPALQLVIENFMETFYPASRTAALGLSIVKDDGKLLYSNGYGMADVERGVPALNSTQFPLGSISKGFTAMLAVKVLHEQFPHLGEGVLDIPIRKLLPNANFILVDRYRSEHLTFRDLLSHKVCIENNDMHVFSGQVNATQELVFRSRYNEEICKVRSTLAYNNQVITVAGEMIATLTNKSYQDAIQDLWNELGMHDTTFVKITDDYSQMHNRAMPYYFNFTEEEYHLMNTDLIKRAAVAVPSGGIISTPDDMVRYMRALINLGEIDGKQVVPREPMEWLQKVSNWMGIGLRQYKESDEDFVSNAIGYGLGLELVVLDGWKLVGHGGHGIPYNSQFITVPDLKLGIFSISNTGPITNHPLLLMFIFELLKGNSTTEAATARAWKVAEKWRKEQDENQAKISEKVESDVQKHLQNARMEDAAVEIVGTYGSGSFGEIVISEKFHQETGKIEYYIEYGNWYQGWLQPAQEEGTFTIAWTTEVLQDRYALGGSEKNDPTIVIIYGDTLFFRGPLNMSGSFRRGLSMDMLPIIPWDPTSC